MAVTTTQTVKSRSSDLETYTLAASTAIYAGEMVVVDTTSGLAAAATKATGKVVVGIAEHSVSTTNGDTVVVVRPSGVSLDFYRANDTNNPIVQATVESTCYVYDSMTVTALSTGSSSAGIVKGFDSGGVWVRLER